MVKAWMMMSMVLAYSVVDFTFSVIPYACYQVNMKCNLTLIPQYLTLSGYSFTQSPIDLLVLTCLRSVFVFGLLLSRRLASQDSGLFHVTAVPHLALFIVHWTFTLVKLLAFAETSVMFGYLGVWLNLTWNLLSSVLLIALWHFVFDKHTADWSYRALLSQTEVIDDDRTGTFKHALRLLKYCEHQWRWFLAGFFFLMIYSTSRVFIPYYTGQVISNIVQTRGFSMLIRSVIFMSLLTLISTVFGGLRGGCFDYATALVNRQMRCDLFKSLVLQEIGFFDATKTGEITSRLTADCQTMSSTVSTNVNVFLRNIVMLIGALVFMFVLSWRLSVVTFIAVPVVVFLTKLYGAYYDRLSEQTQTTIAAANQVADEVMSTMRTVRSFACELREANRFRDHLNETVKISKKKSIAYMGYTWTNEFCDNAILVAVLFYGGHLVLTGKMTADNLISFLLYQLQLGENLYNIGYVFTGLMESIGASRKVFEYMLRQPKVVNDGKIRPPVKGEIEFNSVTFTYPSRPNNPVLQDVSFVINPGETVALVGPSGGGKSSIVSLIEHFYDCDSGQVLIDGVGVAAIDHEYLHQMIALVAQEPVLYDGSVRYNILYGCDWATEQDMLDAAKMANVHNFIMEMEKKYDTNCGEKGVQLSGGQKQRIAIARALVRRPMILILDEATSALDAESEFVVQEAIAQCVNDKTVIVIAHRLSTVEKADRIIVINKGRVVQEGQHEELLAKDGLYRSLVQRQLLGKNANESVA